MEDKPIFKEIKLKSAAELHCIAADCLKDFLIIGKLADKDIDIVQISAVKIERK